jgi:polysaccharide export outer membrane protein
MRLTMKTKIFLAAAAGILAVDISSGFGQTAQTASSPAATAPAAQPPPIVERTFNPADSYVIGPHDELSITVHDEAALTSKYRVDESGYVSFPYIERIMAGGATVLEFQERLRTALTEFIRNPQVRVAVESYRSQSVMVSGAVRTPQKVAITGMFTSLLEVLAIAGSPTAEASNEVIVTRKTPTTENPAQVQEFRINRRELETGRVEFTLRDGDFISVPVADRFFIDGQVRNPGTFVLEAGMTMQQAIALAGGLTDRGSTRSIRVKRIVNGVSVELNLDRDARIMPNDFITIGQRLF